MTHKPLDFSQFRGEMNKLSPSRYLELESLVLEKDILGLQESLNQRLFTISELVVFYLR
jgi:hypothetical protein